MSLDQLLASLGLNVASNALYEIVRRYARSTPTPTAAGLKRELTSALNVLNAEVAADRIIEFLAHTGTITISGTQIFAAERITMASRPGTRVSFGGGSISRTNTTSIEAGYGARVEMQGGAMIVQNPDGSITFGV